MEFALQSTFDTTHNRFVLISFFLYLVYPVSYTFFLSEKSFSFQWRKKGGLGTNKVYSENTTCNEMEVWRLSSKWLVSPIFFVRRSPKLPLSLTTNNRSRCEYIEWNVERNTREDRAKKMKSSLHKKDCHNHREYDEKMKLLSE